jgi:hypothetical protein
MRADRGTILALAVAALLGAAAAPAAAAPPPNDAFEAALAIGAPPTSASGTVLEATRQPGEPNHVGSAAEQTVWYAFAPPADGRVAIEVCTPRFDSVLAVYTGDAAGALTLVAANDDGCGGFGSRVIISARAGTTYRIAVAPLAPLTPLGGGTGDFTLEVKPVTAPANDDFAEARVLSRAGRYSGSTLGASQELGERSHHGSTGGSRSVWYRWRAPRSGLVRLDTVGSEYDTVLAVYTGGALGALRRIASNDDGESSDASRLSFRARRGVTYRIAVDGFERGESGEYVLTLNDGGVAGVGLTLAVPPGQTLAGALARGLRTTVGCERTCRIRVEALVGEPTRRALGLPRRVLASTGGRLPGDADEGRAATLRFPAATARALRRRGTVTLTVRATLLGSVAADRTLSRQVRLGAAA